MTIGRAPRPSVQNKRQGCVRDAPVRAPAPCLAHTTAACFHTSVLSRASCRGPPTWRVWTGTPGTRPRGTSTSAGNAHTPGEKRRARILTHPRHHLSTTPNAKQCPPYHRWRERWLLPRECLGLACCPPLVRFPYAPNAVCDHVKPKGHCLATPASHWWAPRCIQVPYAIDAKAHTHPVEAARVAETHGGARCWVACSLSRNNASRPLSPLTCDYS